MSRAAATLLLLAPLAFAQERPDGATNWVTDEAGVVDPGDRRRINETAKALLRDKKIPILVVTVPGLQGRSVEEFARTLFDTWGIGSPEHNYGMLLLVAIGDRRARIELGADWGTKANPDAHRIMQTLILPRFKEGDYSKGIWEGVRGLDALARGDSIPSPSRPFWWWPMWIGLGLLAAGSVASIMIQGDEGWGAILVRGLLVVVVGMFFAIAENRSRGGGGGGSFGGGFSGGGGASGSW